jgi:hypothetical protein
MNRPELGEEIALGDGEAVEGGVTSGGIEIPLVEAVGDLRGEGIERNLEPLGGDLAQPAEEVGADAVEVDSKDEPVGCDDGPPCPAYR